MISKLPLIQPFLLQHFNFWKSLFIFVFQATYPWCQDLDFGCQLTLFLHKLVSEFSLPNNHFRFINPFKLFATPRFCIRIIKNASIKPSSRIFLGPWNPPCKGNSTPTFFNWRIFAWRRSRHNWLIGRKRWSLRELGFIANGRKEEWMEDEAGLNAGKWKEGDLG